MKTFVSKKIRRIALAPLALVSGAALATEPAPPVVDTTELVTTIESATGPVSDVGIAVLSVLATVMVFFLIRRVMR
ncbi:major capsid protein [Halomonas organivorans]